MTTDHLGNLYVIKGNNILVKYNNEGDSTNVFNEIKTGKVSHIDATNPLRVLLYFSGYNQITILDNMLSRKNTLKLNSIGLYNVTAIANSADGNIWLYESIEGNLMKIDDNLKIKQTTTLRNILEEPRTYQYLVEEDRILYATDYNQGIDKFDLFGFYNTTYHFKVKELQKFNQQIVYYESPNLVSYNLESIQEKKLTLPNPETILQVRTERNNIYIRRENSIDIYQLP